MKTVALLFFTLSAFGQQVKPAPQVKITPAKTAPAGTKSGLDKATLEAYLRYVELWLPAVEVKIDDAKPAPELPGFFDVVIHLIYKGSAKEAQYYVSADGKKVLRGDVFEINKSPFQANLNKLKTDQQPTFGGPAGAPVTLVMFNDFQCPICKEEAQILRENLTKSYADKVRIYFVDFPLDSIHNWAHTAAIAGRCVYKQSPAAFWDYFDWAYENQQAIGMDNFNSKFQIFASEKKLDGMALGRCVENKASDPDVIREIALGHALEISATPTLFINGRKIENGLPWQTIEQLINIELDHQTAVARAAADDACCTVTIPKIVK
jgi:protein-disulfide isomerase